MNSLHVFSFIVAVAAVGLSPSRCNSPVEMPFDVDIAVVTSRGDDVLRACCVAAASAAGGDVDLTLLFTETPKINAEIIICVTKCIAAVKTFCHVMLCSVQIVRPSVNDVGVRYLQRVLIFFENI